MAGCRLRFAQLCRIAAAILLAALPLPARGQPALDNLAGAPVIAVRIAAESPIPPEKLPPLATRPGRPLDIAAVWGDVHRMASTGAFVDVRPFLMERLTENGDLEGVEVFFDLVDLSERPAGPPPPDEAAPWRNAPRMARFQSPDPLSGIDPRGAIEEIPRPDEQPGEQVVDVRIEGREVLPAQKINALLRTRAGRPFDRETMDDDVRRLVQSRMFLDVKARTDRAPGGGLVVVYTVVERPLLNEIQFVGNKKLKASALTKEVNLTIGSPLDPYTVDDAREKIEQLYKTKGFSNTTVEVLEGDKPGDRNVVFLINEGVRQKVWWVEFEGNTIATDARLKTQIQSKPPILWVYKGYVDKQKIEADVEKLTAYYRSLGFFRARIGRELEWNEEHSWLTLRFVIDEGPRYVVRSISVTGNLKFTSEELQQELKIKPGDFFDQPKMNADVLSIQDQYGSKGYIFANVQADPRFLEEPGQLDLVYNIEEGARYRVGRIDVKINGEGNPHTRIRTVLNRLSLRPGDIVDTRELRASERRLKASQLFNVDPSQGNSPKIVLTPQDPEEGSYAGRPQRSPNARGQSPDSNVPGAPPGALQPPRVEFPPREPQRPSQPQPMYRGQSPEAWTPPARGASPSANRLQWQPGRGASDQRALPPQPQAAYRPQTEPEIVRAQSQDGSNTGPNDPWIGYPGYRSAPRAPATASQVPQFGGPPPQNSFQPQYNTAAPASPPVRYPAASQYAGQPQYAGQARVAAQPPQNFGPPPQTSVQPPPYSAQPPQYSAQPPQYSVQPPQYSGLPPASAAPPLGYGGPPPQPGLSGGPVEELQPPLNPNLFQQEEPDQFVTITPTVEEARTGRLMFGVGVNSDAGLVGNVVLEEQNFDITRFPTSFYDFYDGTAFRGDGQRLRLEAVPGTEVQRYMFNFNEPYLLGTPVSFGVSGFIYDRRFQDWTESRMGGQLSLGYQISPDLSITSSIRAQDVLLDAPRVPTPPEVLEVLGHTDLYTARLALAHDTRDSAFLPTEGHLIELAYEQGFGEFDFPRGTLDVRQFFLIRQRPDGSGRHVIGLNGQVGVTGNNTPVFENFFAGGTTTLRGFRFRGASPVNMGTIVGGELQILGSAEYLFPLTADDALRAVVFCDFGTVEEELRVDLDEFRVAPGFGLRISVPALGPAPIALDLAFPIAHADTDDIQNFSFRVGLFR